MLRRDKWQETSNLSGVANEDIITLETFNFQLYSNTNKRTRLYLYTSISTAKMSIYNENGE